MTIYRQYLFMTLGFFVLSLVVLVGCGKPTGYVTYKNDGMGYAIGYPYNWQMEITEDAQIVVIKSPTGRGSVQIYAAPPITARDGANRWMMSLGTAWSEVTVYKNEPRQGLWDWYLSYDWQTEYGLYYGEAYFKQTEKHLYKLDTAADKNSYENYPFDQIISTFKLLGR